MSRKGGEGGGIFISAYERRVRRGSETGFAFSFPLFWDGTRGMRAVVLAELVLRGLKGLVIYWTDV